MRLLELFCGTKSIGRCFEEYGFDVVSLDKDAKFEPTICEDILNWDYGTYSPGYFDVVWASPECTQYSIARSNAKTPRNLEYADSLVQKALEIIQYFNPRAWFLENPASGLLKTRQFMYLIPCVTVSYCKYGAKYQKHTMLWGTVMHNNWRPKCKKDCESIADGKHQSWAQKGGQGSWRNDHTQVQLFSIPKALCLDIVLAALHMLALPSNELYV